MERIIIVLHVLQGCASEAQRKEYNLLLRALAPLLKGRGDKSGMVTRVAKRLQVKYGYRKNNTYYARPYAFTTAVLERPGFEERAMEAAKPRKELQVGDAVLCRGQTAILSSYDPDTGHCAVTFGAGEDSSITKTIRYHSRFGKGFKSARLQRPPALLAPPPRKPRKDKLSLEVIANINLVYKESCPTSPHQRDRVRRLVAPHCWDERQAMIQTDTLQNIFNIFVKEYPENIISFTKFKMLKPWNLKKAYRETCLCRMCELFQTQVTVS